MTKTAELREEIDKLQATINCAVDKFIKETGHCDINIDVEQTYFHNDAGQKQGVSTGVIVSVTI